MILDDSSSAKLIYLKNQITIARQKLNRAWAVNQTTDTAVLEVGAELDALCNEYERLINKYSYRK